MPILTKDESDRKKYFERVVANFDKINSPCQLDFFEYQFHLKMQNPADSIITFNNIPRGLLHNGLLSYLSKYFCSANGDHLFGQQVGKLIISNVCLKGYNYGLDQMPDGTKYVGALIAKNPNIKCIDLSNTQLGDEEAQILINALMENTKLIELELKGNSISESNLNKIQQKLDENKNDLRLEIAKKPMQTQAPFLMFSQLDGSSVGGNPLTEQQANLLRGFVGFN